MPLRLTVVTPTVEGVAALVEWVTGQKPDLAKIRAQLPTPPTPSPPPSS